MRCLSEASKKGDKGSVQVEYNYTGPQQTDLATHIKDCNPRGPLVVHVSKLLPKPDSSGFDAYARVFSGSVKPGDRVRVLGEAYDPDDEEDSVTATVSRIWIFQAQYRVPISSAAAGLTPRRLASAHSSLCNISGLVEYGMWAILRALASPHGIQTELSNERGMDMSYLSSPHPSC